MSVDLFGTTKRSLELQAKLRAFMDEHIYPRETVHYKHMTSSEPHRWTVPTWIPELQAKAKAQGLWNLFLPIETDGGRYGASLTNLEYAPLAEIMGRVPWAPDIFNCGAPDTGNMEVLARYGSEQQKTEWLLPLLNGDIRSCFAMTEPNVASSDATNMEATITRDGDSYVCNGRKWWTSGAMDPRCAFAIFMGRSTDQNAAAHQQHSMVIIPMKADGVKVERALTVFGFDDAPHGHAEVSFTNVRVPLGNMILGEGRGFEIAQGRLGPGRIHHCMRLVGIAERALELMKERALTRVAFGRPLARLGPVIDSIALSRCEIDQARLLTLKAAYAMDTVGPKGARDLIAMIKVVAPSMAETVISRAIQVHGGAGVSQDFPLAMYYITARTLRLADGPDEVHRVTVARMELGRTQRALSERSTTTTSSPGKAKL